MLVFERAPEPLDKDVVAPTALAIHADREPFLSRPVKASLANSEPWSVLKILGL
jgi:hypothetical protein